MSLGKRIFNKINRADCSMVTTILKVRPKPTKHHCRKNWNYLYPSQSSINFWIPLLMTLFTCISAWLGYKYPGFVLVHVHLFPNSASPNKPMSRFQRNQDMLRGVLKKKNWDNEACKHHPDFWQLRRKIVECDTWDRMLIQDHRSSNLDNQLLYVQYSTV